MRVGAASARARAAWGPTFIWSWPARALGPEVMAVASPGPGGPGPGGVLSEGPSPPPPGAGPRRPLTVRHRGLCGTEHRLGGPGQTRAVYPVGRRAPAVHSSTSTQARQAGTRRRGARAAALLAARRAGMRSSGC